MAEVDVRVPNIGDFSDVPIIEVMVAPGDSVAVEDPLVTLESDKATMEVPSSRAGTVKTLAVKVGDKVSEGTVLLTLDPADAAPETAPELSSSTASPSAPAASPPDERSFQSRAATTPASMPEPASYGAHPNAPRGDHRVWESVGPPVVEPHIGNGIVHASPSVRRFARELGVPLTRVHPTGPHDRVTREDVAKFVKAAISVPGARVGPATLELPPAPSIDFAKFGPVETVALSRIRKLSGPTLHRNWLGIPHVTNNDEADVTELETFRKRINAERNVKLTMLAFAVKAAVAALQAYPDVNSSLDGETLILKKYYNVGFAADTPAGLVVPVLKNADARGLLEIASETAALAAKAREGKLSPADMTGATFTISSLGGIGGTSFSPIINAPEVAILGISRASMRPVWDGTGFVPRLMLPLSLSYDHRVIDGALAARFNARLAELLGDPRLMLL